MKLRSTYLLVLVFLLSACAPSQEEIQSTVQVSIAQTQNANPTDTPIPTETATATVTASPSPTPDLRVIDIDPKNLLLQKSEMPVEGKYYLPNENWTSPLKNSEIVASWTVQEGQAYLAETGRIHGWFVTYARGTNNVLLPQEIDDNAVIYSNAEGAQIVVTKYGDRNITESGYTEINAPSIGDISRAFMLKEPNSGGNTRVWIQITFSYRNIYHAITLFGWENEVSLDLAVSIAKKSLNKLQGLPLSNTVTFAP